MALKKRPTTRRRRSIGDSMSQKPSAPDARTGPNRRLAINAMAITPAAAAQGSSPRAARQPALSHVEAWFCASTIAEPIMAPITTTEKTIT